MAVGARASVTRRPRPEARGRLQVERGQPARRSSGPFGYRRGDRPRLCQYPGPGVSTVCRRLVAFHDQRPAPSPQLTPSPPTCNRNGPRRKVLRRWWRGWKLGNSRNPMSSPSSDLATDTQIPEFQAVSRHVQQQSRRAQPHRVLSTPGRAAVGHRTHTIEMSLDPASAGSLRSTSGWSHPRDPELQGDPGPVSDPKMHGSRIRHPPT